MRGNSIAVEGRIYPQGRDEDQIDLRYSAGGTAFSNFTISAWSHKDDNGDNQYVNHRCIAFGELAEHIAESLQPGDTVIAFGRLQQDNYETDDGTKRYQNKLMIADLGVSLRWSPATPVRTERSGGSQSSAKAPKARDTYADDEAPF